MYHTLIISPSLSSSFPPFPPSFFPPSSSFPLLLPSLLSPPSPSSFPPSSLLPPYLPFPPQMLTQLMSALGLSTKPSVLSRFEQLFSLAWSRNGDSISRLYAGTRALALEGKMKVDRQLCIKCYKQDEREYPADYGDRTGIFPLSSSSPPSTLHPSHMHTPHSSRMVPGLSNAPSSTTLWITQSRKP